MNRLVPVGIRTDPMPTSRGHLVEAATAIVACLALILRLAQDRPRASAATGIVLLIASVSLLFGVRMVL